LGILMLLVHCKFPINTHPAAAGRFRRTRSRFISHGMIVSETVTLLRYRASYETAVWFLDAIRLILAIA